MVLLLLVLLVLLVLLLLVLLVLLLLLLLLISHFSFRKSSKQAEIISMLNRPPTLPLGGRAGSRLCCLGVG